MHEKEQIETGDWIRFRYDGKLVIDMVEYRTSTITGHVYFQTIHHGEVSKDRILEIRKAGTGLIS